MRRGYIYRMILCGVLLMLQNSVYAQMDETPLYDSAGRKTVLVTANYAYLRINPENTDTLQFNPLIKGDKRILTKEDDDFCEIIYDDMHALWIRRSQCKILVPKAEKEQTDEQALDDNVPNGNAEDYNAGYNMKLVTEGNKTYNVYNVKDEGTVYKSTVEKKNCFMVISKQEYRLYVYEAKNGDTALVAHFPVCYAILTGPKTREGDFKTPECGMGNPFYISDIRNASYWKHDFGDGRGSILSYGPWFMRLKLNGVLANNTTIGIHGSTNNERSVPGRDSEGCIRLRDNDLKILHNQYSQIGTKVIIKGIKEGKYKFEQRAEKRLGNKYVKQKMLN